MSEIPLDRPGSYQTQKLKTRLICSPEWKIFYFDFDAIPRRCPDCGYRWDVHDLGVEVFTTTIEVKG